MDKVIFWVIWGSFFIFLVSFFCICNVFLVLVRVLRFKVGGFIWFVFDKVVELVLVFFLFFLWEVDRICIFVFFDLFFVFVVLLGDVEVIGKILVDLFCKNKYRKVFREWICKRFNLIIVLCFKFMKYFIILFCVLFVEGKVYG